MSGEPGEKQSADMKLQDECAGTDKASEFRRAHQLDLNAQFAGFGARRRLGRHKERMHMVR